MKISYRPVSTGLLCGIALSASAMAQPSIQLFGVLDVGLSYYRVSAGEKQTELSDHGNTSSRLGFRGTEDLGQGLKAEMWLEGGFDTSQPGSFSLSRKSTLGLVGGLGEIRLGRDYTPSYSMISSFGGPWGTNGVGENLLYRARSVQHAAGNAGQSTNVRSSNAVQYILPKGLNGLSGQFMYGFDEQVNGHAGRFVGGRIGYKIGQFDTALAYHVVGGGLLAPDATPRAMKSFSLGASYRFGFGKLSMLYIDDRVEMQLTDKKLRGMSIGLEVPAGPGEIRASIARVAFNHSEDQGRANKVSLGYVYPLSKRTALYSSAAYIKNQKNAKFTVGGAVTGLANRSAMGIDIGLRHRF